MSITFIGLFVLSVFMIKFNLGLCLYHDRTMVYIKNTIFRKFFLSSLNMHGLLIHNCVPVNTYENANPEANILLSHHQKLLSLFFYYFVLFCLFLFDCFCCFVLVKRVLTFFHSKLQNALSEVSIS